MIRQKGMLARRRTVENADQWFWCHVTRGSGCWLWTRGLNKGYGYTSWGGTVKAKAHRVAWELTYGPIPAGLHVLHDCDVPACVRPYHLHLGTHQDNMREALARERFKPYQASWECCPRGHPFDTSNTYIDPRTGWRRCRRCTADRAARYRSARPEAHREAQLRWKSKQERP